MQFIHNDLGILEGGELIEVTLDKAANVRLMDASNFSSYRNGRRHEYFGGHITRSPYRMAVPRAGHWHVAVDLGGYAGSRPCRGQGSGLKAEANRSGRPTPRKRRTASATLYLRRRR